MILKDFDVLSQAKACQGDNANKTCCAEELWKRNGQSGSYRHVWQSMCAYYRYRHKPVVRACKIDQFVFAFDSATAAIPKAFNIRVRTHTRSNTASNASP